MNLYFEAINKVKSGEVVTIHISGPLFVAYGADGVVLAQGQSARRISEWALECGALKVRHEYDLREER